MGSEPDQSLASIFAVPEDDGESKLLPLGEAIRTYVRAGDHVHASYTGARPCALLLQLAREFAGERPRFTLSIGGLTNTQHALVELGLVTRLVTSFAGENHPVARPSPAIARALGAGRLEIENWSLWTLTARLMAGALGLPFLPVRSLRGSSIASELAPSVYREISDPFTPGATRPVAAVAAMRPDVVLLHGVVGDSHGNIALAGPYGEGPWAAAAARRGVIASVERLVPTEELRRHSSLVQVPAHLVLSVSEAPLGAHPYGLNDPGFDAGLAYVEDDELMAEVGRATRDERDFAAWIGRWVTGVEDHRGYVELIGERRVAELHDAARPDAWARAPEPAAAPAGGYSSEEMMIVAAGRAVARAARARGHDAILAGVGVANLAAWMAHAELGDRDVELIAELGMYGYEPRPGEPFVFAQRNVNTAKILTDIAGVLGGLVAGPATSSIGVLGAAQVDPRGNINSTRAADGRFLVGSGGANDIATAADEIVLTVAHDASRLVGQLPYVTAPGHNVSTLVTGLGVFERGPAGVLELARALPRPGAPGGVGVAEVWAGCGWDVRVRDDCHAEPEPTAEELRRLRAFDPRRLFLGDPLAVPASGAAPA